MYILVIQNCTRKSIFWLINELRQLKHTKCNVLILTSILYDLGSDQNFFKEMNTDILNSKGKYSCKHFEKRGQ